jgi:hypothetical protein
MIAVVMATVIIQVTASASTIGLVPTVPKERALSGEPLSIHHGEIWMAMARCHRTGVSVHQPTLWSKALTM